MADQTVISNLTKQILASSDPSKWTGEGFGSAQANAEDMAKILSGIGITDISQFGKVKTKQEERVSVRPVYDDNGNITAYADQDNNILSGIDPKNVLTSSYGEGPTNYELVTQKDVDSFGNKLTGQAVGNTYGERQVNDAFGGTYAGSGNTGYRVQFDAQGNPHFYTSGQSSSSASDVMPFIQMALLATGAGGLLGGALNQGLGLGLGSAGSAALGGATLGGGIAALTDQNVLKGAALGGLGGYAGSELGSLLNAGVSDTALLQAAADADMAAGMLPEFGTNAAYDSAMANLMAGSPGAVQQLQSIVNDVSGAVNPNSAVAYDVVTPSGAAKEFFPIGGENANPNLTPAAIESGLGTPGYGFNAGAAASGLFNPATIGAGANTDFATDNVNYSNEGRNYPTTDSTQGTGGSPANASTATTNGLPGINVNGTDTSGITNLLGRAVVSGLLGAGAKTAVNALNNTTTGAGGGGGGGDGFNPVGNYTFNPSMFQASMPNPNDFRPGAEVVTVADAVRRAQAAQQQQPVAMAEGGQTSSKPKYTAKAQLAAMSPWERAAAQFNNAAYAARMPVGAQMPKSDVQQLGSFAGGGGISDLGAYSDGGRMLKGPGDGMSDSIPARIGAHREARLADGEFVIPADVVSGLGNGSTDAGAKQLYKMMDRVRMARTGSKKQGREINAAKQLPV